MKIRIFYFSLCLVLILYFAFFGMNQAITQNGQTLKNVIFFGGDTQIIQGPSGTLSLRAIMTGDVDNDGLNELVVGWRTSGKPSNPHSVGIYKWTGGNYTQISSLSMQTGEAADMSIDIGDVDGDGQKELVVMNASPSDVNPNGKIRIYKYSNGTFQLLWSDNLYQGFRIVETGNLDTDTAEEIVIGNSYYDRTIYMYDYQGYNIWEKTAIEHVGEDCLSVKIADADNDGQNEIIAGFGVWPPYSVRIYKYSAGSYQKIWSYSFCSVSPYGPHYYLDVGDTDNDGKNEIFVTESQYSNGEANPNDAFIFEHAGGYNWILSWAIDLADAAYFPYIGQIQNQEGNELAFLTGDKIYIGKWNGSTYSPIGYITGWADTSWITGGDVNNDSYHETIIGKGNSIYIVSLGIPAHIDIDPNTLNLQSKGGWITCYIELPEDYDVNAIDDSTVKLSKIDDTWLENPIFAEEHPTEVYDYDSDGILDLKVEFNRQELIALLKDRGAKHMDMVKLTVTADLTTGERFVGSDIIKVTIK